MRSTLCLTVFVACAMLSSPNTYSADALKLDNAGLLQAVHDRKAEEKATAEPVPIRAVVATLCSMSPPQQQAKAAGNPHAQTWIDVYALHADNTAFKDTASKLPPGTIVIKEKRRLGTIGKPPADKEPIELFTVMFKREAGYYPEGGDWEYAVVNGDASRVLARGKLESCMECHRLKAQNDFLYRSYLKKSEK